MRGWTALALVAASCGGPRTGPAKVEVIAAPVDAVPATPDPEPPAPDSPVDWSKASWATEDDARALWRALELTAGNYYERLEAVPAQARDALAIALIREGNFGCAATPLQITCTQIEHEFLAVPADATIDDPCLRRELALWSLDQLDDETLTQELVADVIALAGLPPPEAELNRAVLYRVQDETIKLRMLDAAMRAGNHLVAEDGLGGLSQAGLEAAAGMHIDAAVESLPASSTAVLGRATLDPLLRRDTRLRAATELGYYVLDVDPGDPSRQAAYDAVVAATKADDCAVAGAAKAQLAAIQNRPFPAPIPKAAKAAAVIRHMCEVISGAVGDPLDVWDQVIDERGVTVRRKIIDPDRVARLWEDYPDALDADRDGAPDVDEADPDGDGDPRTSYEIVHYDPELWVNEGMYADDLRRVLPDCEGTKCYLAARDARFTLSFRKGKQHLVLDAVAIEETTGPCVPGAGP